MKKIVITFTLKGDDVILSVEHKSKKNFSSFETLGMLEKVKHEILKKVSLEDNS